MYIINIFITILLLLYIHFAIFFLCKYNFLQLLKVSSTKKYVSYYTKYNYTIIVQ